MYISEFVSNTCDGKPTGRRLAVSFRREGQALKETDMSNPKSHFLALLTAVSLVAPMAAMAQQGQRPAGPPTAEIAKALGVSEVSLKSCLPMPPQAGGKAPAKSQEPPARPDATKIAICLKSENKSLTKATVEKVLGDFAPPAGRG
jgi:hypothetical protein